MRNDARSVCKPVNIKHITPLFNQRTPNMSIAIIREQLVALWEALKASPPSPHSVPSLEERCAVIVRLLALEDSELLKAMDRD